MCAQVDTDLSGVSHTEVDFDRPEWVPAMRDVVAESSPEHLVKMSTLVCWQLPPEARFLNDLQLPFSSFVLSSSAFKFSDRPSSRVQDFCLLPSLVGGSHKRRTKFFRK